jgi:acyl-coenzyme A synthetase/AMP-(fatty) acid ligase
MPNKNIKKDAIIKHCRKLIAGFKIPRQIDFVTKLPKSAMSKILKNELRKIYSKN